MERVVAEVGRPGKSETRGNVRGAPVIGWAQVVDFAGGAHALNSRAEVQRDVSCHAEIVLAVEIQFSDALASVVGPKALCERLDDSLLEILKCIHSVGGAKLPEATI